ncbi:hypothetical protein BGZ60DRAFT_560485 [Tricladium varicosporioides]|nr:hypothetical protein BGZ60DRAFT_560485 [Hymenoscyphus varicosporioides]
MEDFIELGIESVDKVVDKHFHKVPDKYLHKDTYNPRNIPVLGTEANKRRQRRRNQNSSEDSQLHLAYDSEGEEEQRRPINMVDNDRGRWNDGTYLMYDGNGLPVNNQSYNPANTTIGNSQGDLIYSQDPPHQRPQYIPYTPPPTDYTRRPSSERGRGRGGGGYSSGEESDASVDSYDRYQRQPRRPITRRRSSSYHGPRSGPDNGLALAQRGRRGSNDGVLDSTREKLHKYKLKEEVEGYFSTSTPALTGSAVGALIGGWASHKAQIASGRDKKGGGTSNAFLTLLGAAAGGLAVDAAVNQWEERKKETRVKEKAWDEKWNGGGGRDGRSSRGGSPSERRRRRDSFDN